jgi:hypothetical protein
MQSGAGSAPTFNAQQAASDQSKSNVQTGIANATLGNTNQVTPYGNLTYAETGGKDVGGNWVPSYTATQTLSPEQQAIYNKTTGLQSGALDTAGNVLGQVNNTVNTPLNFSGAPALPQDQTALRDQAYGALTARSNQDLDRQTEQQKTQLANQGLAVGSEAYNNAMVPLERARVDASNQATINAGNIAGQNLSQAQTLRNQYINELQTTRNQPLSDYQALLGFGGGVQQPTYATPTQAQIANTDVVSPQIAAYQGQTNAYNQGMQSSNSTMGGLFGLGGSALMAGAMFA